jgi:hypothetical protein
MTSQKEKTQNVIKKLNEELEKVTGTHSPIG